MNDFSIADQNPASPSSVTTNKILKMGKMKDSSLLKWTQNNKNNMLSGSKDRKKSKEDKNKNWLHSPERLTSGHIAYLVKVSLFLSLPNVRLKQSQI